MYWKHTLLCMIAALASQNNYAFFCPSNYNQIDIGNTQQQIDEACGKPSKISASEKQPDDNSPQEWSYFVKQTPLLGSATPGNIKATIAFDKDGQIINMTINGLSVSTANFCSDTTIHVGTKRDLVKKSCGEPAYINKAQNSNEVVIPKKVVEYQYDGSPPVTLVFENGILTERK